MIDSDQKRLSSMPGISSVGKNRSGGKSRKAVLRGTRQHWYTVTVEFFLPEHFRASNVLASGPRALCPQSIPSLRPWKSMRHSIRLGFATVRNHLANGNLSISGLRSLCLSWFYGFFLEGKWIKATPTFNIELAGCRTSPPWKSMAARFSFSGF